MRPTMSDVAKAASVSTATVSRALAGDPRVKEETRRFIAEVAANLGYTPNRTASALRQGKTWMIGVVTPSTPRAFSDPFYLEFLGGLGDRVMEEGYNLVIAAPSRHDSEGRTVSSARDDGASERFPVRSIGDGATADRSGGGPTGSRTGGGVAPTFAPEPRRGLDLEGLISQGAVDAVVLTEPKVDDPRLPLLRGWGVPFAFLGMPEEGGTVPDDVSFVDGDNEGSSKEAVEHLISLGHRRIACLMGEEGLAATKQRLSGYLAALREAGIPVVDEWIVAGDSTKAGGRRAMEQLLALGVGGDPKGMPSAVFAGNDLMAVGALRAARDAGLRVPEDLSIVGFDGILLAELVDPGLTTVKQPIYEFGRRLGDALLAQLDGVGSGPGGGSGAGSGVGSGSGAGVDSGARPGASPEAPADDAASNRVRREIVPGRLTVRGSTGPPASAVPRSALEPPGSAVSSQFAPTPRGVVPGG